MAAKDIEEYLEPIDQAGGFTGGTSYGYGPYVAPGHRFTYSAPSLAFQYPDLERQDPYFYSGLPQAPQPPPVEDDYVYTRDEYEAAKKRGEVLEDTYEEYVEGRGQVIIDPESDTVLDTLPGTQLPDWWIPGLPEQWFPPWDPSGGGLPAPSYPEEALPPLPPEFQWPEGLPGEPTGEDLPPLPIPPSTPGPAAPGPTAPSTPPSVLSRVGDILDVGLPLLGLLGALTADDYEPGEPPALPPDFEGGEALPPLPAIARHFQGLADEESYFTYGQVGAPQSGEALFIAPVVNPFSEEVVEEPGLELQGPPVLGGLAQAVGPSQVESGFQRGGEVDYWEQNEDVFAAAPEVSAQGRYVKGGGSGREDKIRAQLSDGEYVMDAETVSLLGDGSGDEGARRLDEMRQNLRKHKAKKFSKGEFSHKAKNPDKYMGRLRRSVKSYEHGGVHNVGKGGRVI